MILAVGVDILDVVRIVLEHRQRADDRPAMIHEDDHRMTV